MSNHIHLVIGGVEDEIHGFFKYFVARLDKELEDIDSLAKDGDSAAASL